MTKAELLKQLEDIEPDEEITFRVIGTLDMELELCGRYFGLHNFPCDVDEEVDFDEVDGNEVKLWL